jgi:hypothetical protein
MPSDRPYFKKGRLADLSLGSVDQPLTKGHETGLALASDCLTTSGWEFATLTGGCGEDTILP